MIVDLFAGGGGASCGIEAALGRSPDLAINHNWDALRNHALNHKTRHMVDDLRDVWPLVATRGQAVSLLWASPDCKHYSRAKNGKPRDESIRTLPWEVVRWARDTRPAMIALENVPEFLDWGPLGPDQQPDPDHKGETFREWLSALQALGYVVDWRKLSAADYGAPTIRERFFLVARRDGKPVRWPEPTHGPGTTRPWRTAAEVIDWSDTGRTIFEPHPNPTAKTRWVTCNAESSRRRVARGLVRFAMEADRPFLVPRGWGERAGQLPRVQDADRPLSTIVAGGIKHAVVIPWVVIGNTGMTGFAPDTKPLNTITSKSSLGIACAHVEGTRAREVADLVAKHQGVKKLGPDGLARTASGHVIADVTYRMLTPDELKLAQGFPADYKLEGTRKVKVRLIGNSVPPQLAEAIVRANMEPERRRRETA